MAASAAASLTQLAQTILAKAQALEDFLSSEKLPQPSFEASGPKAFPVGPEHSEIHAIRHALIDATKDLQNLVAYPADQLKWTIMTDHTMAASLHAISHFKIAEAVPADGSISFSELAKATGLSELNVARIMRRAAVNHIFVEATPGHVSHTATSALLGQDPQMQALVAHMSEEAFPASAKMVEALEKFPYSGEPNESPFTLAFGSSFFERKMKHPETMQRFGMAMSSWSHGDGSAHIRDCYDWAALPKGSKVVDVGGAVGHISLAVAEKFPDLEFIIEDQPPMAEGANTLIAASPKAVADRVKFVVHDFFQPHPEEARAAAAYFMRYILHDWSDAYAQKILKNVVDAMGPQSKLIIADATMPPAGVIPRCQEEILRSFDISMLAQLNAQERTVEMWEQLVKVASDGKLGITNIIAPPKGESVSIIEIWFV
ncbi:S-adenosyl-L-methionine-dependent methyltransferase [Thozetella sp. PMI_491]|nr:S-adenosyl-L-methionine-dependent methyltransferase [Thozetella sp. PMI_491]